MKITVSFQQLEHTEALDLKIHEKSQKLKRYFDGKGHIKWNCFIKDNFHYAEIDCVGLGATFHAKAKTDNLYKSLDLVISKVEKQMHKHHGKIKNKIHRGSEELKILDYGNAWLDHEDIDKSA